HAGGEPVPARCPVRGPAEGAAQGAAADREHPHPDARGGLRRGRCRYRVRPRSGAAARPDARWCGARGRGRALRWCLGARAPARQGPAGPGRASRHRPGIRQAWADVRATARELVAGARYLVARGTPGAALGIMALHRFLYGVNFIALILISRNLLVDPTDAAAGLAMFGLLSGISFAGNGLAIVLTPLAHERMSPSTWVVVCLGLGAGSQVLLAIQPVFG